MEAEKIALIRKYLSKQGIKYYDVQAELIDHFASAVEQDQYKNPELTFKEALHKAHIAFGGVKGFWKYEKEAETNAGKKLTRLLFKTLANFFRWPYAILTLCALSIWFVLRHYLSHEVQEILIIFFSIVFIGLALYNHIRLRKVEMLLPKRSNWYMGFLSYYLIYLPGVMGIMITGKAFPPVFAAIYFSVLSLVSVSFYYLPDLAIKETKKIYPQMA